MISAEPLPGTATACRMLLLQGQRLEGDGEVSLAVTAAQLHRPARAESFMGEEFGDPMLLAGKDMHDLV